MTIETKALVISEELKKKVDMICRFACVKYELINGSVIGLKNTNIAYAKPHMLKANGNNYLLFDKFEDIFINGYDLLTFNKEYKLNYYEIDTDDNLTNLKISSETEVKKIIRLITLKDEKFDNCNLKLEVITINLDSIKNNKIQELLDKARDTFREDEFV